MQTAAGFVRAQVLETIIQLDIPDVLAAGPRTSAELAADKGSNKVLSKSGPEAHTLYRNNSNTAVLRADHPNCMRNLVQAVIMTGKPWLNHLTWAMQKDKSVNGQTGPDTPPRLMAEREFGGQSLWEWQAADPARDKIFNDGMAEIDKSAIYGVIHDHKWGQYKRLVDIGGGYGQFTKSILLNHDVPSAVVFDQPHVVEPARKALADTPLKERIMFSGGSFFDAGTLPAGRDGDAFLLRQILHDWSDKQVIEILKSCRRAMGASSSRLLIVEQGVGNKLLDRICGARQVDIHMMGALNGAERSPQQWQQLLSASGFAFNGVDYVRSPFNIVQALPI
ncbi:hypothetical protein WJX73_004833 [Symbiochloris irregularis]